MVHIGPEKTLFPKWKDTSLGKYDYHGHHRDKKCCHKTIRRL